MRFAVIIGAARSGTKFLRGVLEASDDVRAVPYDVNYIWRQGLEQRPDDVFQAGDASDERARAIRAGLVRAAAAGGPDDIVLEKTVSNTLRVGYVAAVLPEARFVHLVRDGRDVAESAARMWQASPDPRYFLRKLAAFPLRNVSYGWWYAKNLLGGLLAPGRGVRVWGPRYPGIETDAAEMDVLDLCARQWQMSVMMACAGLAQVPAARVHTVRYEDLVAGDEPIATVCEFLGLRQPDAVLERFRQRVRRSDPGKWRRALTGEQQQRLDDQLGPVLGDLGYR